VGEKQSEESYFLQFPTLVQASSGSTGIISGYKPPLQVSSNEHS